MTPAQCRAARALLNMTQPELAAAAGLGLSTVVDFEKSRRRVSSAALEAMQSALERAGAVFTATGVEGPSPQAGFAGLRGPFQDISSHVGAKSAPLLTALTAGQIRAARALLKWSAEDLARETALGINTIRRAELADTTVSLTAANQLAIRRAFESAGVVFIDENGGGGRGVRLRKK